MKTKNEIFKIAYESSSTITDRQLMLEVLVDIRDLLAQIASDKFPTQI